MAVLPVASPPALRQAAGLTRVRLQETRHDLIGVGVFLRMLMEVTHAELQHTYSQLKARYLPEAVIVSDSTGRLRPALCYIVPDMPPGQAEVDHVEVLATAAESLGFPDWYLTRIRSFLPTGAKGGEVHCGWESWTCAPRAA
ncbi:MAG: hypothetical protein WBE91_02865 [Steroidobacteraceae bacterium]